jgi:hypothetical protein
MTAIMMVVRVRRCTRGFPRTSPDKKQRRSRPPIPDWRAPLTRKLVLSRGPGKKGFTDRIGHCGARKAAADRTGSLGTQLALKT